MASPALLAGAAVPVATQFGRGQADAATSGAAGGVAGPAFLAGTDHAGESDSDSVRE